MGSQYLPLVLQKTTLSSGGSWLAPGEEEMELSTFMSTVMDALIHHHSHEELEVSSTVNLPATVSMDGNSPCLSSNAATSNTSHSIHHSDAKYSPSTRVLQELEASPTTNTPMKSDIPPRLWTSLNATQPLLGDFKLKPDSVLIWQPSSRTSPKLDWVLQFAPIHFSLALNATPPAPPCLHLTLSPSPYLKPFLVFYSSWSLLPSCSLSQSSCNFSILPLITPSDLYVTTSPSPLSPHAPFVTLPMMDTHLWVLSYSFVFPPILRLTLLGPCAYP